MDFYHFNPWWRDGKVPSGFLGRRRKIFNEIIKYLDKRQISLFTGLRRVGKTTLMYQIIDEILKQGENPYNILYFSFDEMKYDFENLVKEYEIEVLREDISKRKVFIFLDEIQKLKDWVSKVKLLYDLNPKTKIFLSGSAQITMWREARESLAGRVFDFLIKPLDFNEYLGFTGSEIDPGEKRFLKGISSGKWQISLDLEVSLRHWNLMSLRFVSISKRVYSKGSFLSIYHKISNWICRSFSTGC